MVGIHVDYAVSPNCENPDSYGMICVQCNQCGRFNSPELTEEKIKETHAKLETKIDEIWREEFGEERAEEK